MVERLDLAVFLLKFGLESFDVLLELGTVFFGDIIVSSRLDFSSASLGSAKVPNDGLGAIDGCHFVAEDFDEESLVGIGGLPLFKQGFQVLLRKRDC